VAEEIDEFPQTRGRAKGRSKYPFDEWFNGKIWRLDAGEDFSSAPETFRTTLSKTARARGIKIRTAMVNDKKSIVVQKLDE
jgi:hypothetical protein